MVENQIYTQKKWKWYELKLTTPCEKMLQFVAHSILHKLKLIFRQTRMIFYRREMNSEDAYNRLYGTYIQ